LRGNENGPENRNEPDAEYRFQSEGACQAGCQRVRVNGSLIQTV